MREQRLAELAQYDLSHRYVPAGCAWTIDRASVALWIPPEGHPLAEHFGVGRRDEAQYEIYGERAELLRANDALVESLRPREPHWYLDTLATEPERFGQGLAGRLVDHGLGRIDAEALPAALDTHVEQNERYYRRWGFETIASGRLEGEELEVSLMWRPAGR